MVRHFPRPCCGNPSAIKHTTPVRVEARSCHWWTEARTVPERPPSQVQYVVSFNTLQPQGGVGKRAGSYRSTPLLRATTPVPATPPGPFVSGSQWSHVWQIHRTSNPSRKSGNHQHLVSGLSYLLRLQPQWWFTSSLVGKPRINTEKIISSCKQQKEYKPDQCGWAHNGVSRFVNISPHDPWSQQARILAAHMRCFMCSNFLGQRSFHPTLA